MIYKGENICEYKDHTHTFSISHAELSVLHCMGDWHILVKNKYCDAYVKHKQLTRQMLSPPSTGIIVHQKNYRPNNSNKNISEQL